MGRPHGRAASGLRPGLSGKPADFGKDFIRARLIPPDGQLIALLNDRQTIGEYSRIGALTSYAAACLAQLAPGDKVILRTMKQDAAVNEHLASMSVAGPADSIFAGVLAQHQIALLQSVDSVRDQC